MAQGDAAAFAHGRLWLGSGWFEFLDCSNLARQPGADSDDGDDVDWDAEFAELVPCSPSNPGRQASRLSPPPSEAPRPVPRIRGSGRAGLGAGSRRAPAGEAFEETGDRRRQGRRAAPLSRNGPVNPDKRRREAAWAGRIGTPSRLPVTTRNDRAAHARRILQKRVGRALRQGRGPGLPRRFAAGRRPATAAAANAAPESATMSAPATRRR